MISAGTLLHAPYTWKVSMKPTALNGRRKRGPEFSCTVTGTKEEAIRQAIKTAEVGGFSGYAITDIKEVKQ